ncbi:MAG: hypothetical protein ACIARQ_15355 [Phycisphaerales bacterium JB061]
MNQPSSRRGTIYVFVLVSSMIVTMIGLMGYKMMQSQNAIARADAERDEAAVLAESAVHWGIHLVSLKEDWRDAITSGTPIRTMNLGNGQFSATITDPDGDLGDDTTEGFTITGTGTVGTATQTFEVTIDPGSTDPHPSLNESLTVGGTLLVDQYVMSLEEGGTALDHYTTGGGQHRPALVEESNPVDLPDPSLIETWAGAGTVITRSDHGGRIESLSFSSSTAPYGLKPDNNGIYVIDAGGQNLGLNEVRVAGTLVITNLGSSRLTFTNSKLSFGDHGGPTLIVDGDMRYRSDFSTVTHQGLIYVNGDLLMEGSMVHVGQIFVTGDMTVDPSVFFVTINEHPSATSGPPRGFTETEGYSIVPGSWRRIVN